MAVRSVEIADKRLLTKVCRTTWRRADLCVQTCVCRLVCAGLCVRTAIINIRGKLQFSRGERCRTRPGLSVSAQKMQSSSALPPRPSAYAGVC